MKSPIPEKEMIQGCLRNDRKAQKMLYERYFSDMLGICMRYSRDDDEAKDILQNGFIKVFAKFDLYNGEGTLRGWIQSIMVRTALDQYRKNQRELRTLAPAPEDWDEGEDATVETDMAAEEIMRIVQQLPHMQRTIFNLFALEGYSHKEIAQELSITEGTSKWYLCEARKSLKKTLQPVYARSVKENAA